MSEDTVRIDVKNPDPLKDPIVVSFPGGVPTDSEDVPKFVYRKIRAKAKRGRELVGQDNTCLYKAKNDGRGYDGRLTKLCVGLYHKPSKTLTLYQAAERGTVFSLEQAVPGYADTQSSLASMSAKDRRKALFESFGSSKKQKSMKSQEANVVSVDSVVGAGNVMMSAFLKGENMSESNKKALEDAKKGTKVEEVDRAYAEARKNFLPPFDADAKEPHMVYNARDIAGDDAWGQVSRVTDACLKNEHDGFVTALTSRGHWYSSVVTVLGGMGSDVRSAKYQIKCAILLNHMVCFHRQRKGRSFLRGPMEELASGFKLPKEIATRFLDLFTTSTVDNRGQEGFAVSKQLKDKCLVHILLLYLMTHGKTMKAGSLKPIAEDIQIELREAAELLRFAGCSVSSVTGSGMHAALKVPLTFPPPKRGGRGSS